jgi:hypothetical protein
MDRTAAVETSDMRLRHPLIVVLTSLLVVPPASDAAKGDRDGDGLPDRFERVHKLKSAAGDADRDKLDNLAEFRCGTDPRKRDSDRDGRADAGEDRDGDGLTNLQEDAAGTGCKDRDSDDDGTPDGREPGAEVVGVDGDVVTVKTWRGKRVRALVTDATALVCPGDEDEAVDEEEADEGAGAELRVVEAVDEVLDEVADEEVLDEADLDEEDEDAGCALERGTELDEARAVAGRWLVLRVAE